MTVFEQLTLAAYEALGLADPPISRDAFLLAAEAAWDSVAGAEAGHALDNGAAA